MANEETLAALLSGAFSNRAPADLEQFGKTISQNNLYNMAAAPIMQTKFDTSTWSPTQKIASAFLQSFLGNSLAEYGRKSDAEQIAKVNQVLPQLYNDPSSVAMPEGVDRGAFEAFRATQINRKAQTEEAIRNSLGQQGIDLNPNKEAKPYKGYTSAISEILGAKTPRLDPNDPDSPTYKRNKDNETFAKDLRKEFQATPAFSTFEVVDRGFRSMNKALAAKDGISAFELVKGAVQMIEPGLSVNQGEAGAVTSSTSIPEAWKASLNAALNGGTPLPKAVEEGIINLAQRRYDEHSRVFNTARDFYGERLSEKGLNPENLTYAPRAEPSENLRLALGKTNQAVIEPEVDVKANLIALLQKVKEKKELTKEERAFLELAKKQASEAK